MDRTRLRSRPDGHPPRKAGRRTDGDDGHPRACSTDGSEHRGQYHGDHRGTGDGGGACVGRHFGREVARGAGSAGLHPGSGLHLLGSECARVGGDNGGTGAGDNDRAMYVRGEEPSRPGCVYGGSEAAV
ncbi:hypothetical protein BC936DRAFT_138896 [Jimgerdemannia flammicorona]|uniref:Uncharacterized protein n=1 Tax=Jimgerdemannia flammicorona TaxID=994334 RepID=A0A433BEJ4_9FUNG|nr:hypothetical protein BC936DRAFT_138896 [Jimgerdemannia flammicorona]